MKMIINDLMQFSDLPDELKSPSLADRYENTGILIVNFNIPSEYSTFNIFNGILSQPISYGASLISGILSQPLSIGPLEVILTDDIPNDLIDDVSNDLVNFDFINGNTPIDGVLSQPMSVSGSDEFDCLGIGGTDATQIIINSDIVLNSPDGAAFKAGLYEIGQSITASQITIEHNGTYMGRIAAGECRALCISPSREPGFFSNIKTRRSLSGQVIAAAGGYGGEVLGVDFRYKVDRTIYTDFQRAYVTQIMAGFPFFLDFDNDDWLPRNKFYGQTDNQMIFQSSINGFKYSRRFEFREAF